MIPGIYRLIDGSLFQKVRFDHIANNLANINTNAFKKEILSFDKILSMEKVSAIDFTQGPIAHTGSSLDVALEGPGFFKIQTPRGTRYTRNGAFTLNGEGLLITKNGDTVLGQNGPMTINGSQIFIERDGRIIVDNQAVDKISLVDFKNRKLLKKEGMNYFLYQGGEEDIIIPENTHVQQNYLERSNVNPTEEMIKMIEVFRSFESVQKAIQSMDEITDKMVNDTGLFQ